MEETYRRVAHAALAADGNQPTILREYKQTDGPRCGTDHDTRCWMSTDICGWVCAILVYVFMLFASYAVYSKVLAPWPPGWGLNFHIAGYFTCMLLAMWSHAKTMLTDPGSVPADAVPLRFYDGDRAGKFQPHDNICKHCKVYKPKTSHHCSICNRCIVRMDHHCPWANNCIGQNNHKSFVLFISYTFLACVWTLYLLTNRAVICGSTYERQANSRRYTQTNPLCDSPGGFGAIWQVLLGVEAVFFALFTLCMICDATTMFSTGSAIIDQKKTQNTPQQQHTWSESFAHVFGGDGKFSVLWLLPIDARWKNASKQFGFMLRIKHLETCDDADNMV